MTQEPVSEGRGKQCRRAARWRWGRELLRTGILAVVLFAGMRTVLQPYAVEGSSMQPGVADGERLFVSRALYLHLDTNRLWNLLPGADRPGTNVVFPFQAPERGDVIVFDPPAASAASYVKRIVGLPGETVSVRAGRVAIDGVPLAEPYLDGIATDCHGQWCTATVPPDSVYVLGDNRLPYQSVDSRAFGPVGYDRIIGQAIFRTWPFDTFGPIPAGEED